MRWGEKNLLFSADTALAEIGGTLWLVQVQHYTYLAVGRVATSGD